VSTLHVTFRVGNAEYAIDATDVLHLESFTEATHVPGAPAFVAGVVHVRGKLVPVVDLRKRFGLDPAARTLDSRVIVVKVSGRVAGLLVDSAREVVCLDAATFEPPPELLDSDASGFVRAVSTQASRLLLVVDVPRLIGEEASHA
jgi:purine-binding chemotaxis protein CheW